MGVMGIVRVEVPSPAKPRRPYRHLVYGFVSLACPLIALALILAYQSYAYDDFFQPKPLPLDDADINAGAMMGAVIMIQLILSLGVGSMVGLVFAGLSLKNRTRIVSVGTFAVLYNLVPVGFLVRTFVWGL